MGAVERGDPGFIARLDKFGGQPSPNLETLMQTRRAAVDAGVSVVRITWNTYLPTTCADGIVETYTVRVSLGQVTSGPDVSVFSGMTLGFPDGGPAAAETAASTLDDARR